MSFYRAACIYHTTALQKYIWLSSTEAEYVALSETCKVTARLRRVPNNLGISQDPTVVYEENCGTFKWVFRNVGEDLLRTKHIDKRFNYARQMALDGHTRLEKIENKQMIAGFLTKPLNGTGIRKAIQAVQLIRTDGEAVCWRKVLDTIST